MKSRRFWLTLFAGLLGSVACTGPAAPPTPPKAPAIASAGNPFQDQVVRGEPPPIETRGTLELRVVHARGGAVHPAYVALVRAGTADVVWTDQVSSTLLPLGAGTYDARIDRLGGAIVRGGIVIEPGKVTRVELVSDTGALRLEALDDPNGVPRPADLEVTRAASLDVLWASHASEATLVLAAGTYDVHCEREGQRGRVKDVVVRAGSAQSVRCVCR